jgi:hypothetical protein
VTRHRLTQHTALHAVLNGDDQHLADHPEAEPEQREPDPRRDARGMLDHRGQSEQRRRDQRQPDERERLVASGALDQPAGDVRR